VIHQKLTIDFDLYSKATKAGVRADRKV
jgi:hypothetical protein